VRDKAGIGLLGLLQPGALAGAHLLAVVGLRPTRPQTLGSRLTGGEFHLAELGLDQCWAGPGVILSFGQEVPDKDGQLSCCGDRRHGLAAPGLDTQEEGAQRARGPSRRPGGLHQHGARMRAALLGDPAMMGWSLAGLAHGATIREAAAEAGALALGLAVEDGPVVIAQVVERLLREIDPLFPDLAPVEPDARQGLLPLGL